MSNIELYATEFEESCKDIEDCDDPIKQRELLHNLPAQKARLINAVEIRFASFGEIP